jgi:hypothetical protein
MDTMDANNPPRKLPPTAIPGARKEYPYSYRVPIFFGLRQLVAVEIHGTATKPRLRRIAIFQGASLVAALAAIVFSFDGSRLFGFLLLSAELVLYVLIPLPRYLGIIRQLRMTDPHGSVLEALYGTRHFFLRRGDDIRRWPYDSIESINHYLGIVVIDIRGSNGAGVTMPEALCPAEQRAILRHQSGLSEAGL